MQGRPPLILLVGLHRSGTSLAGSLLAELGVPLPGPLIDGDRHNPEGYFERADVTDLQERLLIRLGRWWPSQAGVRPLPAGWLDHPATREAAQELGALLDGETERHSTPWAIKDPRTSLLLPLWRLLAAERGLPLRLVLCLRDPAEATTSLVDRDRKAAGMTPWRAQQLWWRHNVQIVLDGRGLPLLVLPYDRWFQGAAQARAQLENLALFCRDRPLDPQEERRALARIRPEHRRSLRGRLGRWPTHPRLRWLQRRLLAQADARSPRPALEAGLADAPLPLTLPGIGLARAWRHGWRPVSFPITPRSHPWAAAALALQGGHQGGARVQLARWKASGGPSTTELALLALGPETAIPPASTAAEEGVAAGGPLHLVPFADGADWDDWQLHAWLQHLPGDRQRQAWHFVPPRAIGSDPEAASGWIALHLQPVDVSAAAGQLLLLSRCALVLDPDAERVALLRRLGVRARLLTRRPPGNGWLTDDEAIGPAEAARRLGLPDPVALTADPGSVLALGQGGPAWDRRLASPVWGLPGFDQLVIEGLEDARLLAAWLDRAQRQGLQLLRFDPDDHGRRIQGLAALGWPDPRPSGWMPPQRFAPPLDPGAVVEELAWRQAGCPSPPPVVTPTPAVERLWEQGTPGAAVSVCISLHNYADTITGALESVRLQTLRDLELIVVDDASSDGGPEVTRSWLDRHAGRFRRTLLLRHCANGGLAAARNSAFAAATAPWAQVLDADNRLLPEALARCLAVARAASPATAVVHGLLEVEHDPAGARADADTLVSPLSWQRRQFLQGNVIDAMALVRVEAWRRVGGWAHIPGGWEDFDFWCLLIEAGFHGVLCPQRLAVYRRHGDSMVQGANRHVRRISRLLQHRHPWLTLPMAGPDR